MSSNFLLLNSRAAVVAQVSVGYLSVIHMQTCFNSRKPSSGLTLNTGNITHPTHLKTFLFLLFFFFFFIFVNIGPYGKKKFQTTYPLKVYNRLTPTKSQVDP